MKPFYKEMKNFIHNTMGMTKEYFLNLIEDLIRTEVENQLTKNKNRIREIIEMTVRDIIIETYSSSSYEYHHYPSKSKENIKEAISSNIQKQTSSLVKEIIKEDLETKINIDVKLVDNQKG
ncbi:hypothetical protein KC480_05890 [Bacillus velezensis]|uniref:hypothetical protein n=1 Tax=Bacillus velezensis TaxID=492670 RepID=UPI001E34C00E|nr:hypothetical protein [Bacillus velezensis]MCD7911056.1 hypothetical protein [Bacillus velezensis]